MREESLFSQDVPQPLASRMRPETLDEFAGQQHLIGKGKVLYNLIEKDCISSMTLRISRIPLVTAEKSINTDLV